ncbi:hypothetical protein B0J13DRAFT_521105 [Dactylonectria estremocensis]|uniref:Uncharacterized protein n=1 Tax=Dactylonectria estremocensis TaxID=1079267 RepID=A0A9P9F638_9HYPO|nr:hypothetical protein B0J13DRAFT_521105 [Dactylonectria estremocensis]
MSMAQAAAPVGLTLSPHTQSPHVASVSLPSGGGPSQGQSPPRLQSTVSRRARGQTAPVPASVQHGAGTPHRRLISSFKRATGSAGRWSLMGALGGWPSACWRRLNRVCGERN